MIQKNNFNPLTSYLLVVPLESKLSAGWGPRIMCIPRIIINLATFNISKAEQNQQGVSKWKREEEQKR